MPSKSLAQAQTGDNDRSVNELTKLWRKYKPELTAYVNDLNTKAGSHLATLRQSVDERKRGEGYGPATTDMLEQLANAYNPSALGIIKAPGGNWLSGSIPSALKGLKLNEGDMARRMEAVHGQRIAPIPEADRADAINNWIDKQLAKYVQNEMATERDPLRALAEKWAVEKPTKLAEAQAKIDAHAAKIRQVAQERGVPEHYLTEMRQEMIPLEKAKGLIEARGGLHHDTTFAGTPGLGRVPKTEREAAGFPAEGLAKSTEARGWENLTDNYLDVDKAGNLIDQTGFVPVGADDVLARNPWLAKVPPETPVHAPFDWKKPEDLGFNHLIDELRNATNPESGLPAELLLKYADLPKVTVPQAVERVADINAWRAAQKAEADLLRANNAATVLHKDYPDKGFKWVELKQPSAEVDDSIVADALKYEGDQMAHCVGGYCPDVLEGRSRIFSLRDAKGKPHVTIETLPPTKNTEIQNLQSEFGDSWEDYADPRLIAAGKAMSERIKQIKGFKNGKPDDEYLPMVQDFVKSGKWSDVGDLGNTGLMKISGNPMSDIPLEWSRNGEGVNMMDLVNKWHTLESPPAPGSYLTKDELRAMLLPKPEGFAAGGIVQSQGYNSALVDSIANSLRAEMFN